MTPVHPSAALAAPAGPAARAQNRAGPFTLTAGTYAGDRTAGSPCTRPDRIVSSDQIAAGLCLTGQYTSPDTGLIYLRARIYDPITAQFLSVDPIDELTRQPYNYALDNPINLADPSGLCGAFEVSCYVEEGAKEVAKGAVAGAEWVGEHPEEAAGITLGVVSVATGVGAIVAPIEIGEIALTSTELGAASAVTGSVGAGLDAAKCFESGETSACAGFGLNAAGVGLGLGATLIDGGVIRGSAELEKLLTYAGVSTAALGLGVDTLSLPELQALLCE